MNNQNIKRCSKCKSHKPTTEFSKNKYQKSGLAPACKDCMYIAIQRYRKKRQEKAKELRRLTRLNKTSKVCKVCNTDKPFSQFSTASRIVDGHKTICIACNADAINERKRIRREKTIANLPKQKEKAIKVRSQKRRTNPVYRLLCNIRIELSKRLNRVYKGGYTQRSQLYTILGCTFNELITHLENQFTDGMSWDNKGLWHIDHIVPISLASTEEEAIILNHHTNLRPLWASDNSIKGNKLTNDVITHPIYESIMKLRSA